MARHNIDLMDGFDSSQCVYDEKQEKRYHASVWICIAFCMALVLIRGIVWHVEEICMVSSWSYVDAEYNEKSMYANFRDEDGMLRQFNVSGFDPVYEGEVIRLYYKDDISEAEPVNKLRFWLGVYALLGGIMGFSIWRIVRIYKGKKKHSAE